MEHGVEMLWLENVACTTKYAVTLKIIYGVTLLKPVNSLEKLNLNNAVKKLIVKMYGVLITFQK